MKLSNRLKSIASLVTNEDIKTVEKQTLPPKTYNEASLLSAMENAGRFVDDEEVSIGSKMCFDQLGQVIKNFEKKKTIQNLIN